MADNHKEPELEEATYELLQSYDQWMVHDANLPPHFHECMDRLRNALIQRLNKVADMRGM